MRRRVCGRQPRGAAAPGRAVQPALPPPAQARWL